jgi:hypothetical protein
MTPDAPDNRAAGRRGRVLGPASVAFLACVALVLDMFVVLTFTMFDRVQVSGSRDLAGVHFGAPLNWVTQQQSIDPPMPGTTTFLSPWEHPADVAWLPLLANLALIAAAAAVAIYVVHAALTNTRGARSISAPATPVEATT